MTSWSQAAVHALLADVPFSWIHNRQAASITTINLEPAHSPWRIAA